MCQWSIDTRNSMLESSRELLRRYEKFLRNFFVCQKKSPQT